MASDDETVAGTDEDFVIETGIGGGPPLAGFSDARPVRLVRGSEDGGGIGDLRKAGGGGLDLGDCVDGFVGGVGGTVGFDAGMGG